MGQFKHLMTHLMDRLCGSSTDIKNCCLTVCLKQSWIYTLVNDFFKPAQRHCGVILSTVSSFDSPVPAIFDIMVFSRTLVSPEHLCFITPWNLRDSELILWYIWTQRDLIQPLDDHWVNQIWLYQESVFHPSDLYSDISVLNGPLIQWRDLISLGFFFFFLHPTSWRLICIRLELDPLCQGSRPLPTTWPVLYLTLILCPTGS